VFTGGIGENRAGMRKNVCKDLDYIGIKLDNRKNREANSNETIISSRESNVKVFVIPTNEELVIAKDTMEIISTT
ncbi:MAG: acetate kinase, partial [Bacteroidales bacterium]